MPTPSHAPSSRAWRARVSVDLPALEVPLRTMTRPRVAMPQSCPAPALPSDAMSDRPDKPKARDLPDDVRRIVDEIENEIGDDGFEGLVTSAAEIAAPPPARRSKRG